MCVLPRVRWVLMLEGLKSSTTGHGALFAAVVGASVMLPLSVGKHLVVTGVFRSNCLVTSCIKVGKRLTSEGGPRGLLMVRKYP